MTLVGCGGTSRYRFVSADARRAAEGGSDDMSASTMRPARRHRARPGRGSGRALKGSVACLAAVALAAGGAVVTAAPGGADTAPVRGPVTVSADVLPTVQVDGVVWSQAVVGTTVYAGGRFGTARPAGAAPLTSRVSRRNLLAYDIRTGKLITSFAPVLNGQVLAVAASPDGRRVYVAGEFTRAGSLPRARIAAYDTATGHLVAAFHPTLDARARALVATNTTVYVGGAFSTANGRARSRLAALRASDGALLGWQRAADAQVLALALTPDGRKLVVGGQFTHLGTTAAYGMGALDAGTGAVLPWAATKRVRDAGQDAGITSLVADKTSVYGTGYTFGPGGNLEGAFATDPATGALRWVEDCRGDHYSGFSSGGTYYTVGHAHDCSTVGGFPETTPRTHHRALAFSTAVSGVLKRPVVASYPNWEGTPAPRALTWYPDVALGTYTGQNQGAWHVTGNASYVVLGGEFPKVNGIAQQGLVRFAVKTLAPNREGPRLRGAGFVPTLTTPEPGTVTATWTANWDRDNELLTYRLVRDGATDTPVYTRSVSSTFWRRDTLTATDTGLESGRTYGYRLYASDPLGNTVTGDEVSVTVP